MLCFKRLLANPGNRYLFPSWNNLQEVGSDSMLHYACDLDYRKHTADPFYGIFTCTFCLGFKLNFWLLSQFYPLDALETVAVDDKQGSTSCGKG